MIIGKHYCIFIIHHEHISVHVELKLEHKDFSRKKKLEHKVNMQQKYVGVYYNKLKYCVVIANLYIIQ